MKWFSRTVRPYAFSMTVMMICHVLLAACSVGFVYACKSLVDTAISIFNTSASSRGLFLWGGVLASIVLLRVGLNAFRSYLQTKTEIRMKNALRRRLFDILLHMQSDGGTYQIRDRDSEGR